jgi:hypothetical protein
MTTAIVPQATYTALTFNGTETIKFNSTGITGALQFSAATNGKINTLTSGATITPDFALGNFFTLTLTGNATLALPTNLVEGQSGSIFIIQDATGSRTLAYNTAWDFAGGTVPVLSTAINSVDRLDYVVRTTGSIHAALSKAVS